MLVLQGQSLFSGLYCKKPDYNYLRVSGCCCCYPYLQPYNSQKLELRSEPCMFLGYSPQHKGYQYLLKSGKVIISKHVVFDESIFLFSERTDSGKSSPDHVTTHVLVVQSASEGVSITSPVVVSES